MYFSKKKMDTDLLYGANYQVRVYETDNHQQMRAPALSRLMQEAAMQNIIETGISFQDLALHGLSWVLVRQQLDLKRLPKVNEQIRILTYPAELLRFFALRDFLVFDEQGEVLAQSTSTWLVMDMDNRRMASLPSFITDLSPRLPPREQCLPRSKTKVPDLSTPEMKTQYTVHWHDLDFNQHLNNTLYIQWMMDPLPESLLEQGQLARLEIEYRAEAQLHDAVEAQVQALDDGCTYLHRLLRTKDGKELARGRTTYKVEL